jgi:CheY-like chemotaxis protein
MTINTATSYETEANNFKYALLRLSDQVSSLCSLVSNLQDSIKQLKQTDTDQQGQKQDDENEQDEQEHEDYTFIENSSTLIHPDPIALYPSDTSTADNLVMSYLTAPQSSASSSPFIMSDGDSPMMGYFENNLPYTPANEFILNNPVLSPQNYQIIPAAPTSQPIKRPVRKPVRKQCGPLNILIVEDDPLCQQLISHIIKSLRIGQCELVADGVDAVINMSTGSFDLILMDMQLPHLSGLQATQNIRKFNRRTPIVSMTAKVGEEDRRRYFEGGIDEILPKPFDKHSVQRIIEQFFKLGIQEEQNTN